MQTAPISAHHEKGDAVLLALGVDPRRGLTGAEVQARLEKHGRNELTAKKPVPAWRKFFAQFGSFSDGDDFIFFKSDGAVFDQRRRNRQNMAGS